MDYSWSMTVSIVLSGPVLCFGGPYSNLEATAAVLAEAVRLGIPPGNVVCTGDVVAYCADAAATVDLVRRTGIRVVMGNCEEQLAQGAADCGCGFAPGSACDLLSVAWYAHADRTLGVEARAWMGALPRRLDIELGGVALAVVHGGLGDISRFIFASTPETVKARDLDRAEVDGIVAGHCGLPFTQSISGRLWHNPGVVGMPANDGTSHGWFSIIAPGPQAGTLAIEHVALPYDHAGTAAKMRAAGLPEAYADALASGLWPSCDVLPPAEAGRRGQAVAPSRTIWRPDRMHRPGREPVASCEPLRRG